MKNLPEEGKKSGEWEWPPCGKELDRAWKNELENTEEFLVRKENEAQPTMLGLEIPEEFMSVTQPETLREGHFDTSLVASDFSLYMSYNSADSYEETDKKFNTLNFCYTNARSLPPKINNLVQVFDNFDLHFAAISETWMCEEIDIRKTQTS